jgi:hypothetical protein
VGVGVAGTISGSLPMFGVHYEALKLGGIRLRGRLIHNSSSFHRVHLVYYMGARDAEVPKD